MSISPVFKENLELLKRFDPNALDSLAKAPLEVRNSPDETSSEWLRPFNLSNIITLVVYGITPLGEEYLALRNWLRQNDSRTLIFFVDDLTYARTFLETSVATDLLKNPQVIFNLFDWPKEGEWGAFSKKFELLFQSFFLGPMSVIPRLGADSSQKEKARLLLWHVQRNVDDRLRAYYVYMVAQKESFDSYYPNLLEMLNAKFGQALAGSFKGVPAIICGAGPSLEPHLDQLRQLQNHALFFGSGSGLNILSRAGIVPNFGVGVDSTSTQVSRLSTNFAFQVPYFYLNRFNHEALKMVHGEKLFTRGGIRLHALDWFDEQLGVNVCERVPSGMSSSNFAFEIALLLGCNPIIFVGMDLCYKDETKRYSAGVTAHPAEMLKHHQEIGKLKPNIVVVKDIYGNDVTSSWDWRLESECFTDSKNRHPDAEVWNATEGGVPIDGIPNITLSEVVEKRLNDSLALDPRIHTLIQQHDLDFITKEKIGDMLLRWKESLEYCKKRLAERLAMLTSELEKLSTASEEKPLDYFVVDLQAFLGDTPAYTYCLKQFNDVFNGLNGKEYFRMVHYPEVYPTWKRVEMSAVIERERCKFLIEALDFHYSKAMETLEKLPAYPMLPRSPSSAKRESLVEEAQATDIARQEFHYYYRTGELYAIKRFSDGSLDGLQEYFFVDGMPRSILTYRLGALDGEVRLYYPNGTPKRLLHFSSGRLEGLEKQWNESGALVCEAQYADNNPIGTARSWHSNGVLAREVVYEGANGQFQITEWDEKGDLAPSR